MKKVIGLIALMVVAAPLANANPGGTDGCGLGWEVTQKKSFLGTTTRGTTNAVVPPTFGMSTGTIGCDQHTLAKRDEAALQFVASNQDDLMMQMAAGEGEHLDALANEMGCNASFGKNMQKSMPKLINSKTSVELYKGIRAGCSA